MIKLRQLRAGLIRALLWRCQPGVREHRRPVHFSRRVGPLPDGPFIEGATTTVVA